MTDSKNYEHITHQKEEVKLYSARAIGGATYIGGPLAAGYMFQQNSIAQGKDKEGRIGLILGIATTIALTVLIHWLPEEIHNKIPNFLIPAIYTALVAGLVHWKQGDSLKAHKDKELPFYSGWRAFAIGFVSLVIFSIGLFGPLFFGPENAKYREYDKQMEVYSDNETKSLLFYEKQETASNPILLKHLKDEAIPMWEENINIIHQISQIEDLPQELLDQNVILLRYSELRLEAFLLFQKAYRESTHIYDPRLERLHQQMDEQLSQLN